MRMAGHPLGVRLLMNKEGAEHETNWKSGGGLRQASECAAAGRQRKGMGPCGSRTGTGYASRSMGR